MLRAKEGNVKRRAVLQLACATLANPAWVLAQTPKLHRLGWLSPASESSLTPGLDAFLSGMRALGYEVGRNIVVDVRYAQGNASNLPALTDELIALKPDVLLGIESACRVMASRTKTIPIVILGSVDPVAAGLVKSLARPGTNVTGLSYLIDQLLAKQIELLTEIVPKMSRVALLNDASFAGRDRLDQFARMGAKAKGLKLILTAARDPEGVRKAFAELAAERPDGLVVAATGPMFFLLEVIVNEALRARLPAIFAYAQFVEIGGLASYGPNYLESYRNEIPAYVDRILKGANPAEIPVQQSTKFAFAINLKTARELGLKIPPSIMLRADRLIE
jgi:putative ABC transport system substrate-binding protein